MSDVIERILNRIHDSNMDIEILLDDCKIEVETLRQRVKELESYICNDVRDLKIELAALKAQGNFTAFCAEKDKPFAGSDGYNVPLYTTQTISGVEGRFQERAGAEVYTGGWNAMIVAVP